MGRFASTVEFYANYREPYSPNFFRKAADVLHWTGRERLLDVGCGPGLLTVGFASLVGEAVGVDPEAAMLDAAGAAASAAQANLTFVQSRLEDFTSAERFQVITIGRALHWLDRERAIAKLAELLEPDGQVLICGASSVEGEHSPWLKAYNQARQFWVTEDESRYRKSGADWFAGSDFAEGETIAVTELHSVGVDDLIRRALSKSNTAPEALGDRRAAFEHELRRTLELFSHSGPLQEQIVSRATVFHRHNVA